LEAAEEFVLVDVVLRLELAIYCLSAFIQGVVHKAGEADVPPGRDYELDAPYINFLLTESVNVCRSCDN
jgi:hypothetical protein